MPGVHKDGKTIYPEYYHAKTEAERKQAAQDILDRAMARRTKKGLSAEALETRWESEDAKTANAAQAQEQEDLAAARRQKARKRRSIRQDPTQDPVGQTLQRIEHRIYLGKAKDLVSEDPKAKGAFSAFPRQADDQESITGLDHEWALHWEGEQNRLQSDLPAASRRNRTSRTGDVAYFESESSEESDHEEVDDCEFYQTVDGDQGNANDGRGSKKTTKGKAPLRASLYDRIHADSTHRAAIQNKANDVSMVVNEVELTDEAKSAFHNSEEAFADSNGCERRLLAASTPPASGYPLRSRKRVRSLSPVAHNDRSYVATDSRPPGRAAGGGIHKTSAPHASVQE